MQKRANKNTEYALLVILGKWVGGLVSFSLTLDRSYRPFLIINNQGLQRGEDFNLHHATSLMSTRGRTKNKKTKVV